MAGTMYRYQYEIRVKFILNLNGNLEHLKEVLITSFVFLFDLTRTLVDLVSCIRMLQIRKYFMSFCLISGIIHQR